MKITHRFLGFLISGVIVSAAAAQQRVGDAVAQIQRERIQSSYLIAFGRKATNDEVAFWTKQNPKSVGEIVQRHSQYIAGTPAAKQEVITRAYVDALGRTPKADEVAYWSKGGDNYTELMKKHLEWLRGNPAEQENVIKCSYKYVFNRQPKPAELSYWKNQGVFSYAMLIASHDEFKRAHGATAEKTSGSATVAANSGLLAAVVVSPQIAAEARSAAGMVAAGAGNMVAAGAGNMVAAGAGSMVAAGAGNMVAAGAGN